MIIVPYNVDMPEKEPKFSEAEIEGKHEEALAMDKKTEEMVEKGEAVLDDKGYPIPRRDAPMAMVAEDELARLEAAMEGLNIDNV